MRFSSHVRGFEPAYYELGNYRGCDADRNIMIAGGIDNGNGNDSTGNDILVFRLIAYPVGGGGDSSGCFINTVSH